MICLHDFLCDIKYVVQMKNRLTFKLKTDLSQITS